MRVGGWLQPVVGLDVGSTCVKAVALRRSWTGWQLVAAAAQTVASQRDDGALTRIANCVDAVRRALDALGRTRPRVVASVASHVFVKRLSLPAMSRRELDDAIPWLADEHVPFDLAEVHLDYQVLEPTIADSESALEVLLVAARRDRVADRVALVASAGRDVAVLDADAFALVNAYGLNYPDRADRLDALIHVGGRTAIFSLVERGRLVFTRDMSIAGRPLGEPMCDLGAHIVSEAKKTMDFYRAGASLGAVDRVVVSGGGWRTEGLADLLTAAFDAPVETFDPFRRISGADRLADAMAGPTFAVAVGLAMRWQGDRR